MDRLRRATVVGGLCVFAAAGAVAAPANDDTTTPDLDDLRSRVEALRAEEGPVAERGRRLAELGRPVIPILLDALAASSAKASGELVEALRLLGEPAVVAALNERLKDEAPIERTWRVAALEALGVVGTEVGLSLAIELGAAAAPDDAELLQALEESVHQMTTRTEAAIMVAARHALKAEPPVAVRLVRAIGATPSRASVEQLVRMIARRPELDAAVLTEVGRAGAAVPWEISEAGRRRVRPYLFEEDEGRLSQAALTCGRLGDFEACERLVELLAHESEGVRGAAHSGLQAMSGLAFGPAPDRWAIWLHDERAWFDAEGQEALALLETTSPRPRMERALQEVATRRYRRHELALAVTDLLVDPRPPIRLAACSTLGQLASPSAVPMLVYALEDSDPQVVQAAGAALKAITELEHPADPAIWSAALRLDR